MLLKLDSIKKTFCPQTVNETAVLTDLTHTEEENLYLSSAVTAQESQLF